jgi:hypothetical protein
VNPAVRAAVEVAEQFGLGVDEPRVLQAMNNTVVWLWPASVVAKVATRPNAKVDVRLEHAVACELVTQSAAIAPPFPGATPTEHPDTGFLVTLWTHVDGARAELAPHVLAESMQGLHTALAATSVALPSFRVGLARARTALDDDGVMSPLPLDERRFLRDVYDDALVQLEARSFVEQRLHGEPHEGNRLVADSGITWIDLESCCLGPLEWDLALLPPAAVECFPTVDADLLALMGVLDNARRATWCWTLADRLAEVRTWGEQFLAALHASRG